MRIAGVGFSCMDVYDQLNRMYPTGNSVDFVIHMRRMGVQASLVSVVGTDAYGDMMIDMLKTEKIDVSHLSVRQGSTAVFKMELNGNDRVHKEKIEGVMAHFALNEDDRRFIAEHDALHTNLSGRIERELPYFRERGVSIVFDFSTRTKKDISGPILPDVDYAFFSYTEEDAYITEFIAWAQALGPRIVIATLGERGSLAYDGKTLYRGQIVPVEVVNTVGAGDSFCAGFMYGELQGWSIAESLNHGARTAAGVVTKFEPY
ncbi:fructoselysine 6-kinase [Paenibacillus macerans]|uniref:fructoselysine 6-kinase n=1 Tax=Paenibacillus macerans TaxID=44252 RepID=UPI002DBD6102|nr:fructoselysine 6-kinase [Paenibacillus macerans]MEC0332462.1 fructoselysine 6-kinase [Paenibacillus macerans]